MRSDSGLFLKPLVVATSAGAYDFFEYAIGTSLYDIALKFEAFNIGGLDAVIKKYTNDLKNLRKDVADIIFAELCEYEVYDSK